MTKQYINPQKKEKKKKQLKSGFKKTNYVTEHKRLTAKKDSLNKVIGSGTQKGLKLNRTKVQLANNRVALQDLDYWKKNQKIKKKQVGGDLSYNRITAGTDWLANLAEKSKGNLVKLLEDYKRNTRIPGGTGQVVGPTVSTALDPVAYNPAPSIIGTPTTGVVGNGLISPNQWLDVKRGAQPKYIMRDAENAAVATPAYSVRQDVLGDFLPKRQGGFPTNIPYRSNDSALVATPTVTQPSITSNQEYKPWEMTNAMIHDIIQGQQAKPAVKPKPVKRAAVPKKVASKPATSKTAKPTSKSTSKSTSSSQKLAPMKTLSTSEKKGLEKKAKKSQPFSYKARVLANKFTSKDVRKARKETKNERKNEKSADRYHKRAKKRTDWLAKNKK